MAKFICTDSVISALDRSTLCFHAAAILFMVEYSLLATVLTELLTAVFSRASTCLFYVLASFVCLK